MGGKIAGPHTHTHTHNYNYNHNYNHHNHNPKRRASRKPPKRGCSAAGEGHRHGHRHGHGRKPRHTESTSFGLDPYASHTPRASPRANGIRGRNRRMAAWEHGSMTCTSGGRGWCAGFSATNKQGTRTYRRMGSDPARRATTSEGSEARTPVKVVTRAAGGQQWSTMWSLGF